MHTSVLDHYCFKILCLDYEARQSYVALKLAVLGSAVPLTNGKYANISVQENQDIYSFVLV